jgi:hypothetical protein
MTRRDMLRTMGSGFGMVGLSPLLGSEPAIAGPLDVKPTHFPARAKHVIFLFLNGGPSQVDTFDPKPALTKYDGQPMPGGSLKTERKTGNLMRSPFQFKKCGQSGIEVSEIFPRIGEAIDDVCVIRSMYTDRPAHEVSLFQMNCGTIFPGRPSMGAWITYGLGTENQNLPAFLVLCPGVPVVGAQLWSSAFLPSVYQGSYIRTTEKEIDKQIPYIRSPKATSAEQAGQLELLGQLNRMNLQQEGPDPQLEASIRSMEIAYRMQTEALDVFDATKESAAVRARYGDGDFGRGCLMALRAVERGVRVVQVYFGNFQPWDNHDDILIHRQLAQQADAPIAALLGDLKSRGLLGQTLVMVGGEFGRTPVVEKSGLVKVQNGRDHNSYGYSMLLAGGGVRGGVTYGATDDFGFKAVEKPVHPHDLHATILHLLGLDHTRLTYHYSGRNFRLTDVAGNVVKEIIS